MNYEIKGGNLPVVICTLFMQFTASLVIRALRHTKAGRLAAAAEEGSS